MLAGLLRSGRVQKITRLSSTSTTTKGVRCLLLLSSYHRDGNRQRSGSATEHSRQVSMATCDSRMAVVSRHHGMQQSTVRFTWVDLSLLRTPRLLLPRRPRPPPSPPPQPPLIASSRSFRPPAPPSPAGAVAAPHNPSRRTILLGLDHEDRKKTSGFHLGLVGAERALTGRHDWWGAPNRRTAVRFSVRTGWRFDSLSSHSNFTPTLQHKTHQQQHSSNEVRHR